MGTTLAGHAPSDSDLVARAARGNRGAFVTIYDRYHADISLFARTMSDSTPIAEDVTQDVFLVFMRDLDRFDPDRSALRTYLYGIARTLSRCRLRKERPLLDLSSVDEPGAVDDPSDEMLRSQTVGRVRRTIRGLSARYREVLILCDIRELSYEEASWVLETPLGTVRSRLHRARKQLADRLRQADRRQTLIGERRQCLI